MVHSFTPRLTGPAKNRETQSNCPRAWSAPFTLSLGLLGAYELFAERSPHKSTGKAANRQVSWFENGLCGGPQGHTGERGAAKVPDSRLDSPCAA